MGRRWAGAGALLGLALALLAAPALAAEPLSNRVANYGIEASLDPHEHRVDGRERLRWRNDSGSAATDLVFHLYLNAFANNRTTFVREMRSSGGASALDSWKDGWGSISIDSLRLGGVEMVGSLETVQPDDANPDDRTVVRLPLPSPVPPGGSVELEIDFTSRLPKLLARTGWFGDFHFVAQWFPKLGVFADGRWNCHQFHANSEFFADFGVYDVSLRTPASYVVGASGVRQSETDNGDGTRTVRYLAEDVHDFAWTADPALRERRQQIDGVDVLLLCHERDCRDEERFFGAVRHSLAWFGEHVGRYPYANLTVVVPPPFAGAAGGMEYPTLITTLSPRWIPSWLRLPELVTVHEFGHQYWYGMVASNEFEEAWLDEGVNSYTEGKITDAAYGREAGVLELPSLRLGSLALRRGMYISTARRDPATIPAWEFVDRESYGTAAYDKTALTLDSLEGTVGEGQVLAGLRHYFEQWRFRHPRGADFYAAMAETAGVDLDGFFAQTLRTGAEVDYAVTRLTVSPIEPFAGLGIAPESSSTDRYHSTVLLERLGEAHLPVDVDVVFNDGSQMRERWDGAARWRRFEYEGGAKVSHVVIDPDGKLPLDVDPINNSQMLEPGTRGIVRVGLRWGFWFQNVLHLLTSF